MNDPGDELEEIRREIVESRSLTIKTNNLVNGLAADIHSISKRQQGYERNSRVNGIGFYAAVVGLVVVGAKFIIDARVDAKKFNSEDQSSHIDRLETEIKALKKREAGRTLAQSRASQFQQLILHKEKKRAVAQWPSISKLALTKTERASFRTALDQFQEELSQLSYQVGLDHIRARRWHEAEKALQDSLSKKANAPHSYEARYQLARALRTLGRQREAITVLTQLSTSAAPQDVLDDAIFLLAEAQIEAEAWNDAKTTLRGFLRRFPNSSLRGKARSALAKLKLYH